jgi:hypothetical protein
MFQKSLDIRYLTKAGNVTIIVWGSNTRTDSRLEGELGFLNV